MLISGTYHIGTQKILAKVLNQKSMTYYHNTITQKSWEELQILKNRLPFVLIGGWATYLYTHALKSKDNGILIEFVQLTISDQH